MKQSWNTLKTHSKQHQTTLEYQKNIHTKNLVTGHTLKTSIEHPFNKCKNPWNAVKIPILKLFHLTLTLTLTEAVPEELVLKDVCIIRKVYLHFWGILPILRLCSLLGCLNFWQYLPILIFTNNIGKYWSLLYNKGQYWTIDIRMPIQNRNSSSCSNSGQYSTTLFTISDNILYNICQYFAILNAICINV